MKVVVDTSVWFLALRRRSEALDEREAQLVASLRDLVDEVRVLLLGPVRQELLSGIRDEAQFQRLRDRLTAFPHVALVAGDYEDAANLGNRCRAAGLACSSVDLLICAASLRRQAAILTADRDFRRYAELLPLTLL